MAPRFTCALFSAVLTVCFVSMTLPRTAAAQKLDRHQEILDRLAEIAESSRTTWSRLFPGDQRFVVLTEFNDEAVLDRNTGLVWQRMPGHTLRPWVESRYHCANAIIAGVKGWRLPTMEQLSSLLDPLNSYPALPTNHPFTMSTTYFNFWTATRNPAGTASAWAVNVGATGIVGWAPMELSMDAWCVRGNTGADEY